VNANAVCVRIYKPCYTTEEAHASMQIPPQKPN
jgi:hypothetical protein